MSIITPISEIVPDENDPDFNTKMRALLAEIIGLPGQFNGLSAEQFFQVMESLYNTTAGKVMTVGAFGLGGDVDYVSTANALDTAPDQAWVKVSTANVATVNGPSGALGGVVFTSTFGASNKFQTYEEIAGDGRKFQRLFKSSTWGAWRLVYDQTTVVGTVSEDGSGSPTGAVIERGSNANGDYIRFADGTQICTNDNSAITTSPAAFVGTITKIDGDKLWLGRWHNN